MARKVPFVLGVQFATQTTAQVEERLVRVLTDIRTRRSEGVERALALDHLAYPDDDEDFLLTRTEEPRLSARDRNRIRNRASALVERRQQRSGMAHLRKEEIARLAACRTGVALRGPSTIHAVDELAAALTTEMPWMASAIEPLWRDARARVGAGKAFGFRPLLLVGPPGIGKTHLLRRLSELSGTPSVMLDAAAAGDGFSLAGAQRTWGSASPGRPVATILDTGCGNPVVFVDEIDKAGVATGTRGTVSSAFHALLGLLEPVSSGRWMCPFHGLTFDMSHVTWVLAANGLGTIPAPLLSRCRVVPLEPLSRAQLLGVALRELERRDLSPDILADVERVLHIVPDGHDQLNLRTLLRIVDGVCDIDRRPDWH